jgi:hypothetical protein
MISSFSVSSEISSGPRKNWKNEINNKRSISEITKFHEELVSFLQRVKDEKTTKIREQSIKLIKDFLNPLDGTTNIKSEDLGKFFWDKEQIWMDYKYFEIHIRNNLSSEREVLSFKTDMFRIISEKINQIRKKSEISSIHS